MNQITIGYYDDAEDQYFLPTTSALEQYEGVAISNDALRIMELEQVIQTAINGLDDAQRFITGSRDTMRPTMASVHMAAIQALLVRSI